MSTTSNKTASQKEYEHGYNMGYDWVAYEGGSPYFWAAEVKSRRIPVRSSYGMGFKKGCEDADNQEVRKYDY